MTSPIPLVIEGTAQDLAGSGMCWEAVQGIGTRTARRVRWAVEEVRAGYAAPAPGLSGIPREEGALPESAAGQAKAKGI